jgi:hypothetical protein
MKRRKKPVRSHEALPKMPLGRADWRFELAPERLYWVKDPPTFGTASRPSTMGRTGRRLLWSILLITALASLLCTIAMFAQGKSFDSWTQALHFTIMRPLFIMAAIVGLLVALLAAAWIALSMLVPDGQSFEVNLACNQWRCTYSRLGFGRHTICGMLAEIREVEMRYASPSWDENYQAAITFQVRGRRARKVEFLCDMPQEAMNRHRQWLVEKLGDQRVPPARACQPDWPVTWRRS